MPGFYGTPTSLAVTAFPASPATGDRVFRSDRGIEYYYDGTRWLSTQLFHLPIAAQDALNPATGGNQYNRAVNPFFGLYGVWVEKLQIAVLNSATTAANYRTFGLVTNPSGASVGSTITSQNDAQNTWVGKTVTINAVVASTENQFEFYCSPTGTPVTYVAGSFTYRLIG